MSREEKEDLIKERNDLKKRVKELEKKTEMMEVKIAKLKEDREIYRKAYKETKKDKEYLEDIIDRIEEESEERSTISDNKSEVEGKQRNLNKKELGKKKDFDNTDTNGDLKESKKAREAENLLKHQLNLRKGNHDPPGVRHELRLDQPIECRYEKIIRGGCRWGDQCRFSRDISHNDRKNTWRERGYCFSFTSSSCTHQSCKYLHPTANQVGKDQALHQTQR